MSSEISKYPRTPHIEGSRLQPGDEDLESVRLSTLAGKTLVVEEKLDGANAGISFSDSGELQLQSRGHFLTGGYRERHFNLFKTWANVHRNELWRCIGSRFVVYGEWLYAKHTVFYDALPHYFLEFDVLDKESGRFLSTPRRHAMFRGGPVVSVPVIWTGVGPSRKQLDSMVTSSRYKSPRWLARLHEVAEAESLAVDKALAESDTADEMEGLYIKVESGEETVGRYKYIRQSFLTTVADSNSHWLDRPIVPNQLAPGVDIFAASAS